MTHSELSLVEWNLLMGSIPPLNKEEWMEVFEKYKSTPEFILIDYNLSLEEFKAIYWQQAMAYCLALAGKTVEAALMSDILAERSASVHPAFFAAMDRLSGSLPPAIDSLSDPSALYLSMMRTASIALPLDVVTKATAAVTKAIALSPNAPLDLRLAAAESAAERGILASKILADIYSAVPFEASGVEHRAQDTGRWNVVKDARLLG